MSKRKRRPCRVLSAQHQREFIKLCIFHNWSCLRCGKSSPLTSDHVEPFGANDITNIQPLCGPCNSAKGARTIDYRNDPHPNCNQPLIGYVVERLRKHDGRMRSMYGLTASTPNGE